MISEDFLAELVNLAKGDRPESCPSCGDGEASDGMPENKST
jgi:hypothetical protein